MNPRSFVTAIAAHEQPPALREPVLATQYFLRSDCRTAVLRQSNRFDTVCVLDAAMEAPMFEAI